MKRTAFALALSALALCALPALAQEAACTLAGGTPVAEAEAMNALVKAAKFDDLATALAATIGGLAPTAFDGVKGAYPQAFDSCTTVVQRQDVGGLSQHVVVFEGANPLFVYWAVANFGGKTGVISFYMESTLGPVLKMLN